MAVKAQQQPKRSAARPSEGGDGTVKLLDGRNPAHLKAAFLVVVCLALGTRLYKISEPDHVW